MNKMMARASVLAVAFIVSLPLGLAAQDEGYYPYSYARLSYVNGAVYIERTAGLGYEKGEVNFALVQGDRIGTESGQAEIHFGRRNYLRLDNNTKVEFAILPREGEERIKLVLTGGSAYLRVSSSRPGEGRRAPYPRRLLLRPRRGPLPVRCPARRGDRGLRPRGQPGSRGGGRLGPRPRRGDPDRRRGPAPQRPRIRLRRGRRVRRLERRPRRPVSPSGANGSTSPPGSRNTRKSSTRTAAGSTSGPTATSGCRTSPITTIGGLITTAAGPGIPAAAGPGSRRSPGAGRSITTAAGTGASASAGTGSPAITGARPGCTGGRTASTSAGAR